MEPHIYKPGVSELTLCVGFGSLMVIGGVLGVVAFFIPPAGIHPENATWLWFLICFAAVGMGTLITVGATTYRVVLFADAIEVRGIFNRSRLERREIGAKMLIPFGTPFYVLYPWQKKQKRLRVGIPFHPDATFSDWMASIPNADKVFLRARRDGSLKRQISN
jgi:hypothetical protein